MCGIAGFASTAAANSSEAVLHSMLDRIRHRGPDDSGVFAEANVFLGHRRLSIVDVSGGHQPMPNESRSVWITYNGEVFNHAEVRPALERAGHRYVTRSDTETIVHAYEEYGPACVDRFRGMFALRRLAPPSCPLCSRRILESNQSSGVSKKGPSIPSSE